MHFVKRYRTAIASGTVLCVAAALLVVYAFSSEGYPVRQVDLNDGGIWVTSDRDGLFGRLNKPVGALDAAFYPPGGARDTYQLDISQDGSAVVANDRSGGKLYPVDVSRSMVVAEQGVTIGGAAQVQLAGGTLAVLDAVAGKAWAIRVEQRTGVAALNALDPSAPPVATLDPAATADGAALVVGLDGTVHAVAASGKTVSVSPSGTGFGAPAYGNAGRRIKSPRATAVGDGLVVQDAADGALHLPDGAWVRGPKNGVLQQPGPDSSAVILSTPTSLVEASLVDGTTKDLYDGADGAPTAPVRLADCVHGAWAGKAGGYVRSCGGRPATPGNLKDLTALIKPVFRVNRSAIVLNDLATGAVWDLANQQKVDDWSTVKPPPVENPSDKEKNADNSRVAQDKPPKAVDDTLGARPGRTTVLHVLDNDSDQAGNILSITAITTPDAPDARPAIAPDGQTIEITLPEQSQDVHFKYTVDDGKGLNATAAVTVQVRGPEENEPPAPRIGHEQKPWAVVSGGRLSLPVLADWRDFDGDPVVLVDAATKAGSVSTTPTGFLEYRAPVAAGTNAVEYRVSDGVGEPVPGVEQVVVQDASATTPVSPVAQPDVARGQTGQPVTVYPLNNDLPGADPMTPGAELRLAAAPATPPGATITTDLKTGAVVLTGAKPGTFLLDYTAAFGNAPFANGAIRIDVVAAPNTPAPPVAMPDTAVLRGQQPVVVDVLANDFSPSGALLTVQQATPAGTSPQVEVAIVKGRWLRINALTPSLQPNPQHIRYSITDGGSARVEGEVSVTQLPELADDTPVPTDDLAVVRAGDSVTVPVLDNDISPSGAPLSLLANVTGAPDPGQLTVTSTTDDGDDLGAAYVSGDLVRYVPPATVDSQRTVRIEYVAQNPDGDQATGHVQVTIIPAPTPDTPNQPPAPRSVDVRVVAGDTVTIKVAGSGIDPDGDSAAVTGITSPTLHGRVLGIAATSITYQAFPTSSGTDRLGYLMTDTYGGAGAGQVQIAVVPPGDPRSPVAVDDVVTAAPGARLVVDVLANDLRSPDDVVEVEPLPKRNPSLPDDVSSRDGFVELDVPEATGAPTVITYAISNGIAEPSIATLTVRSQEGYNAPPAVAELFAEPEGRANTATVDVLAKADDPDGDPGELTVTSVFADHTEVDDGEVTVPVGDHPRTIAYEVSDGSGATAVGLIHIPAPGAGAPTAIPDKTIEVPADGEITVALSDYVRVPSGKQVRLTTTDRIWAAPAGGLSVRNEGEKQLVLTAAKGYNGPAAVTFEVTDGDSLTDPDGLAAVLTVPVQVGPQTPVLRCPANPLPVVEGGPPIRVDITSVCHVWVADRAGLADLRYTVDWQTQPAGVELDANDGRIVEISAGGGARPGSTGAVTIGVEGFDGVSAKLAVQVAAAAAPSVAPIEVNGVKAGETRKVELVSFVRSQLRDPKISVLSVGQVSGASARAETAGGAVELTPAEDAKGTLVFRVVITDVADRNRADRTATGQITVHVLGVPDQPGTPVPGRTVRSRVVELSWSAPANNGAPIDRYEVAHDGGTQSCPASPCTITGLTNGNTYTFTVRAHNLVGWSKDSARSGTARPDTVPGSVTSLATEDPQDGTLGLRWTAAPNDGTPIERYEVSWTGGGRRTVPGGSNATVATGLDNDARTTFTVVAVNAQGPGPAATVTGQSAGAPAQPNAPTFTTTNSADSASRAVRVNWAPVGPNGPGPTIYTVTRTDDGGGDKTVCANVTATSCADDGLANDGTVYSYSLTAANGAAAADPGPHTSPASAAVQMEAAATPDPITNASAAPTGSDGQATVRFDAPASHGRSNTVTCRWNGNSCGTWTFPPGGQSGVSQTVSGLPNGQTVRLLLQTCNGSAAETNCNAEVGADVTTYGPIRDLNIATSANGPVVNFTVSVNPNGKAATVQIQTSRQSQTFTTGVGAWSWSGSDDVGYSGNDTINVTVSDGVRAPVSQSRSQSTPPPPATVSVFKAGPCGGGGGAACGGGSCAHPSCAYIGVQTANFPGRVTCSFNSDHGPAGFVNESFGANERRQTRNWYGYPGERVYVTCGGVQGSMVWS